MNFEHIVSKALGESQEDAVDSETALKVSMMIRSCLEGAPPGAGLTVQQLSDMIGIKRQTVSATLYNMKKRNEVDHAESTGLYRLTDQQQGTKRLFHAGVRMGASGTKS